MASASSLIHNSPFIPPSNNSKTRLKEQPVPSQNKATTYKLKGVSQIAGRYYFSLIDTRTNTSTWIREGEKINGFQIMSYAPLTHTIEYSWNDSLYTMQLTQANGDPIQILSTLPNLKDPKGSKSAEVTSNTTSVSKNYKITFNNNTQNQKSHSGATLTSISHQQSKRPLFALSDSQLRSKAPELLSPKKAQFQNQHDAPPIPSARRNRIHNPTGKTPRHLQ